ncbi:hypothetical protein DAMA08_036980 [Martiniozyma asiatica (nom. inval.)]|nr:hypothetical protein DAMA08_036980 [Martiniozyma asiatica]
MTFLLNRPFISVHLFNTPEKLPDMLISNKHELITQLADCIISHELYQPDAVLNSSSRPDVATITNLMDVKVKKDEFGHFRFCLLPAVGVQIGVYVPGEKSRSGLFLFNGNNLFLNIFTSFFERKGCILNKPIINSLTMRSCLDDVLVNNFGDIEIWFGRFDTKGKLGSIVVKVSGEDWLTLGSTENLFEFIENQSQLKMKDIKVIRVKCGCFSLTWTGKLSFTSLMSPTKTPKDGDTRLSIWIILRKLIKN